MSCCNKGWVAISGAGPSGPEPALPGPGNSEMQDEITPHHQKIVAGRASANKHRRGPSTARDKRSSSDRSARRFAQDDGFCEGLKEHPVSSSKNTKDRKRHWLS